MYNQVKLKFRSLYCESREKYTDHVLNVTTEEKTCSLRHTQLQLQFKK